MEVSGHATHIARKEKEVEADVPATHIARKQKEMKADVCFVSFFFYSVQDHRAWNGTTHIQNGFSLLS